MQDEEDFLSEDFEESDNEDPDDDEPLPDDDEEEDEEPIPKKRKSSGTAAPKKKAEAVPVVEDWERYLDKLPTLLQIQQMIEKVNATNSSKQKMIALSSFPHCIAALLYANHPYWQYGLKSETVKANKGRVAAASKPPATLFELLDKLKSREATGNAALSLVLAFVKAHRLYEDLVYRFLDKNLKIRCNTLNINKVFPGLVPVFAVALAQPTHKLKDTLEDRLDLSRVKWYASRKLDGVRTIFVVDGKGDSVAYSREGNPFKTLDVAHRELKKLKLRNVVLDTECCELNPDGSEDFKRVVGNIKKKAGAIPNPRCFVFDLLTAEEFNAGFSTRTYEERYEEACRVLGNRAEPVFTVLEQVHLKTAPVLKRLEDKAAQNGWEGLILRKASAPYEAKRTNNMLKVKRFQTEEFVVQDVKTGPMRLIGADKKEYTANVLTNVIVLWKGKWPVSVGSGFSQDERISFAKSPKLILGNTISVQFMNESCDSNGKPSLRHPTYKGLYGKKRKF
jgi:DNA ligase-1